MLSRSPYWIIVLAFSYALLAALAAVYIATHQPWLGLDLRLSEDGAEVQIAATDPTGPAAHLPLGASVQAVGGIALAPFDITEEPDIAPTHAGFARFMDRQGQLAAAMRRPELTLDTSAGPQQIRPAPRRPLRDLPASLWIQVVVAVGFAGFGGWLLSLRPREFVSQLFALFALSMSLAAFPASVYSSRELALETGQFLGLSWSNQIGTKSTSFSLLALFLAYPRQLIHKGWILAVYGLAWVNCALLALAWLPREVAVYPPVGLAMIAIFIVLIVQWWLTRKEPEARVTWQWIGLCLLGAVGYVAAYVVPASIGREFAVPQSLGFIWLAFTFGTLGFGIARHFLFDLRSLSMPLLFYASAAALTLCIDALLIFGLSLDRLPALSLSMLAVLLFYLPLRDQVQSRVFGLRRPRHRDALSDLGAVALAPSAEEQDRKMQALVQQMFSPLRQEPLEPPAQAPALVNYGDALDLPAIGGLPATRMHWKNGGRDRYSARDLSAAQHLVKMLGQLTAQRERYAAAKEEERARINRDMHDNIGLLLLSALHSDTAPQKDDQIRQALGELREIVSRGSDTPHALDELVADLRVEIGHLFEAAGIEVQWDLELPPTQIAAAQAATIKAFLREAATNVVKHSGAQQVSITARSAPSGLALSVTDDGAGLVRGQSPEGKGLSNLAARAEALQGRFTLRPGPEGGGTTCALSLPLDAEA